MNDWRLELEEHQVSFLMVYADVYQAGKTSMSQGEYMIAGRTLDLMAHGSWCMVETPWWLMCCISRTPGLIVHGWTQPDLTMHSVWLHWVSQ